MNTIHLITFILLIIGGLNWLLVGLFGWDIGMLFGGASAWFSRLVYVLVGLAALYELFMHMKMCKECAAPAKPMAAPSQQGM